MRRRDGTANRIVLRCQTRCQGPTGPANPRTGALPVRTLGVSLETVSGPGRGPILGMRRAPRPAKADGCREPQGAAEPRTAASTALAPANRPRQALPGFRLDVDQINL